MTSARATIGVLLLAGPLCAQPAEAPARAEDFFGALGLTRRPDPAADLWHVAEPTPPNWMTDPGPFAVGPSQTAIGPGDSFQHLLDRMGDAVSRPQPAFSTTAGLIVDPGRWRYKLEQTGDFYRRTTKVEVPDPHEFVVPYGGRNWMAQQKLQVPVPIDVPLAEQLFVYGQIDGSGDAIRNQQTSLYGKSGVGVKWALVAGSELQLRYATLMSYESATPGRVQPALEVLAKLPLMGPLSLEYTGAAIPAVARTDLDQIKSELRLAYPLRGDNELEFGARYRWDVTPTPSPWMDRAQLFFGVKLRH